MAKTKIKPTCARCGSSETTSITLKNGEVLPSYVIEFGTGNIYCHPCNDERKANK